MAVTSLQLLRDLRTISHNEIMMVILRHLHVSSTRNKIEMSSLYQQGTCCSGLPY